MRTGRSGRREGLARVPLARSRFRRRLAVAWRRKVASGTDARSETRRCFMSDIIKFRERRKGEHFRKTNRVLSRRGSVGFVDSNRESISIAPPLPLPAPRPSITSAKLLPRQKSRRPRFTEIPSALDRAANISQAPFKL